MSAAFRLISLEIHNISFFLSMFVLIFFIGDFLENGAPDKVVNAAGAALKSCGIFGAFIYCASIIFLAFLFVIEKVGQVIISAIQ